jgi:hypothetical protein
MVPKSGLLSTDIFVFAPVMHAVGRALQVGKSLEHGGLQLGWRTLFPCLNRLWPLRL